MKRLIAKIIDENRVVSSSARVSAVTSENGSLVLLETTCAFDPASRHVSATERLGEICLTTLDSNHFEFYGTIIQETEKCGRGFSE